MPFLMTPETKCTLDAAGIPDSLTKTSVVSNKEIVSMEHLMSAVRAAGFTKVSRYTSVGM